MWQCEKTQCVICIVYLFVYYKSNGHMFWSYFMRKETPLPQLLNFWVIYFLLLPFSFSEFNTINLYIQNAYFVMNGGHMPKAMISIVCTVWTESIVYKQLSMLNIATLITCKQILNCEILSYNFRDLTIGNNPEQCTNMRVCTLKKQLKVNNQIESGPDLILVTQKIANKSLGKC